VAKKIKAEKPVEAEKVVGSERTIAEIIAENTKLRESLDNLSASQVLEPGLARYTGELAKIQKLGRVDSDKIQVKEFTDHKNISLWTKLGKRLGPMHRDNALAAFKRFFELGILLSTTQPTPEEISVYMLTDEYKVSKEKFDKSRALKDKSRKAGQMQKLAEQIAKLTGSTVDAINHVFQSHEIKPLSAGQK
jgi:hypothetical protein